MSTVTLPPTLCPAGVWTLIAAGSTGMTDITIQGPTTGYRVAVGSSPPATVSAGPLAPQNNGTFIERNIVSTDNVYVAPSGPSDIVVNAIWSIAVAGGGGGGGAVTVADGANVTQGAKADAPYADATGAASGSIVSYLKLLATKLLSSVPVSQLIGGSAISNTNAMPILDAYLAPVATSWSSATALNTAASGNTAGYDTVIVTLVGDGSLSGGVAKFEVFDGAAWIAVKAASVSDYTTTSGAALSANMNKGYQIPVAGFPQFRVRLSTVIAAGNLTVTMITSSAPDTSIVTVGLDPAQALPAGTNNIGTVLGPLPTVPVVGQQTLTTSAVALTANALQNGIVITALPANTGTVYVGASGVTTSTGYPLAAGQSISFAVSNASGIFIIGTNATDKIAFAGN